MSSRKDALPYGFEYDRSMLLDITTGAQTFLPILNTLFIHPAVIFLVSRKKSMGQDIRIGYLGTVLTFMMSDWIIFGLHVQLLSPYGAVYCDGPLAREGRLDLASIRALGALTVAACFPCFLFLTVRLRRMVLRGTEGQWLVSNRSHIVFFAVLMLVDLLNFYGLSIHSTNSKKASIIAQRPELAWMSDRRGRLLIFGDFGQPERIQLELVIVTVTVSICTVLTVAISLHSTRSLKECRKNVLSYRTLCMTQRMIEVLQSQLKGSLLHLLFPTLVFVISNAFDTRQILPDVFHAGVRFMATMSYITNSLQFSLSYIIKTRGHRKIVLYLNNKSIGYHVPNEKDPPRSARSTSSTPLPQML